ncbi:DUF6221 family protein [Streptomyces sp. SR-10]|uniref:DUF6221 family protein n=1 Tax=Streptomyces sp. SR-10 TaxID=3416442 RepID=UPI003CFA4051
MDDLAKFLRDRFNEDEQAARRAGDSFRQIGETGVIVATEGDRAEECASANWAGIAEHIVRHDPARILAEVNAKRATFHRINEHINMTGLDEIHGDLLRLLALPYADHPDYKDDWRP